MLLKKLIIILRDNKIVIISKSNYFNEIKKFVNKNKNLKNINFNNKKLNNFINQLNDQLKIVFSQI